MAGNGIRGTAYVLHVLVGLVAGVLPFLGWLQTTGRMSHGAVQGMGMFLVLGFWPFALILALMALVFSFLPRPADRALLLLGGMLLAIVASLFLDFRESTTDLMRGLYGLAALGLGIRALINRKTIKLQINAN